MLKNKGVERNPVCNIVDKIINIHVPINDIQDKIIWKYTTPDENFSVKMVTWTNNDKILPYPRAKLLSYIWRSSLLPKVKIFAWKLVSGKISTRSYINSIGIDVDSNCSFYNAHTEEMERLFISM